MQTSWEIRESEDDKEKEAGGEGGPALHMWHVQISEVFVQTIRNKKSS